MTRGAARAVLLAPIVALVFFLAPAPAHAHAVIVSANPQPGVRLAIAPAVVVLQFSEPLNHKLSTASVIDPEGERYSEEASGQQIRVPLPTSALGVYRVEWTTVSILDGHALRGSYTFGVGVTTGAASSATPAGPGKGDLVTAAARTVEDAALLLAIGLLLLRRLARGPELAWARFPMWIPLAVAFVAGLGVVAGEALAATASPTGVLTYLTSGLPGLARLSRLIAEAGALVLALLGTRLVTVLVGVAVVALAASGHAAAVRPSWAGIAVDALHLLAAGLWAGAIFALALLRPPGGWSGTEGRALLRRFSLVAVSAFFVTMTFGFVQASQEVGPPEKLFASSYGVVLSLKVLAIAGMVPLSLAAWRGRAAPRAEATLAVIAVGVAALLAAYPLPPVRLAAEERASQASVTDPAWPRPGDLTMGAHAGSILVGLTLRPGRPGRNDVLVELLGLGRAATWPSSASVWIDGRNLPVEQCGLECRRTAAMLSGGEEIAFSLAGRGGGVATFHVPALPAPDGRPLFEKLQGVMHDLHTYGLHQVLDSGSSALESTYTFQAPDRLWVREPSGFQIVWIGRTRYQEQGRGSGWIVQPGGTTYSVPSFIWDYVPSRLLDFRVVGEGRVDGRSTQIISFFGPELSAPIWFRLWVDSDGVVMKGQMRAQGHFMDQRYYGFNAPMDIVPPVR